MRPARLLATDIDGTMLRADGTLSDRVRAALHAAVDAGITVVPTTGRPALICDCLLYTSDAADD